VVRNLSEKLFFNNQASQWALAWSLFLSFALLTMSTNLYAQTVDTDGDGIVDSIDIDDDNDGVLDTVENNCPAEGQVVNKTGVIISKPATIDYTFNSNALSNLLDNVDNNVIVIRTPTGTLSNSPWLNFEFPTAKILTYLEIGHYVGQTLFSTTSTYKIQGSADNSTWVDVTGTLTYDNVATNVSGGLSNNNSNIAKFPLNTNAYKYYRIYGITASVGAGWATEIYFREVCTDVDTDNDGIPNRLDLDSDGDGCSDALEAGTTYISSSGVAAANQLTVTTIPGPYGTNGFADGLETVVGIGIYKGTYTYSYATDVNSKVCTDTDGDGVSDIYDLDDDNDGILDTVENIKCQNYDSTIDISIDNQISVFSQCAGSIDGPGFDFYGFVKPAYTGTRYMGFHENEIMSTAIPNTAPVQIGVPYRVSVATANASINAWNSNFPAKMDIYAGTANCATSQLIGTTTLLPAAGAVGSVTPWVNDIFIFTPNAAYTHLTFVARTEVTGSAQRGYLLVDGLGLGRNIPDQECYLISDLDGDGIPNSLDLDSDGDGCPDAIEGGAAFTNANLTANKALSGTVSVTGIPTAAGTGQTIGFSQISTVNACTDTDTDGISDIDDLDDDNDGILDIAENNCSIAVVNKTGTVITKPSTINYTFNNNTVANLIDGVDNNAVVINTPTLNLNGPWLNFEFPSPKVLTYLEIGHYVNQYLFSATSTYKIQGSTDNTNWADVTGTLTYNNVATSTSGGLSNFNSNIANFETNSLAFKYYRILGINATVGQGWTTEIYFKERTCLNSDTDNDGIANSLDLDSDGDGCPDAIEGGASFTTANLTSTKVLSGAVSATGIPTLAGIGQAIGTSQNAGVQDANCPQPDYDGDGVPDSTDLDDDNDGILDTAEQSCAQVENFGNCTTTNFVETLGIFTHCSGWNAFDFDPSATVDRSDFDFMALVNGKLRFDLQGSYTGPAVTGKMVKVISPVTAGVSYTYSINLFSSFIDMAGNKPYLRAINNADGSIISSIYLNGTGQRDLTFIAPSSSISITVGFDTRVGNGGSFFWEDGGLNGNGQVAQTCTDIDTDGDGTPNRLDLDSDGDGCPDAVEAGTTFIATSGVATANQISASVIPAPYGTNGFANGLETVNDNGIYKGTYSYANATNASMNGCTDTDIDGIPDVFDLDDDNDGVLDTIESGCLFNQVVSKTGVIVTKSATVGYTFNGAVTLSNLVDGVDNNVIVMYAPTGVLNNNALLTFEFPTPKVITYLEVGHFVNQYLFSLSTTYKIQASNDNTNWFDLTGSLTYNNVATSTSGGLSNFNSNIATFASNTNSYKYYRIFGLAAAPGNGWATEVYFKESICSEVDTDGDGTPNRLDTDSDGDGCPDAVEAGTTAITTSGVAAANKLTASVIPAPYGTNGFANGLETVTDNGTYKGTYSYNDATNALVKGCTDTDTDGIPDFDDLDDDNDGILDTNEMQSCSTLITPASVTSSPSYQTSTAVNTINSSGFTGVGLSALATSPGTLASSWLMVEPLTSGFVEYTMPANSNVGSVVLWAPDAFNYGIGDAPIKDFTVTLTYGNNQTYTSPMYTTAIPTGNGSLPGAQVFPLPLSFNNVTKIRLNISAGWYDLNDNNVYYVSTQGVSVHPGYNMFLGEFRALCSDTDIDTDGDGIPNRLDLDSDGDGCSDAIEGGASFTTANLVTSTMAGGNSGAGYTGTSTSAVTQNLGNTVGSTTTTLGVPTSAGTGQTIGSSQNAGVQDANCPPPCVAGAAAPNLSATSISNVCPATTVNLTSITASNTPANTTLTWHSGTPATTANKITGTAVAAGTYYAAFFDATNNCYSGTSGSATTAVTVTITICCPTITNTAGDNTNPSACGTATGSIKICGLTANGTVDIQ
jgi:hypothetical protein